MKHVLSVGWAVVLWVSGAASGQILITEWMYQGADGEFIEFTNLSPNPVDMTGWSYDDNSQTPGETDLSAFGIVMPGASVILTEAPAASFIAAWGLSGVAVIGDNTNNLGRNDEINLYNDLGLLVDRLTYGDQDYPGTIRTQNRSGNPISPAVLGTNNVAQWELSLNGDPHGSYLSTNGDQANPGHYVPEPTAATLMALGGMMLLRRRR